MLLRILFSSKAFLGIGFILTGIAIILAEKASNGQKEIKEMKTTDSLLIGAAQGLALLPSISRSGMTITSALGLGLKKEFAADFAFLLSIPAILGAAVLEGLDVVKGESAPLESIGFWPLLLGMAAAFVTGYFAIKIMIQAIKKMKLKYFAFYVFTLGGLIILAQLFFKNALSWLD